MTNSKMIGKLNFLTTTMSYDDAFTKLVALETLKDNDKKFITLLRKNIYGVKPRCKIR